MKAVEVRVWDPFIRIAHWCLAVAVLWNWFTDRPLWTHVWIGYTAATLVALRALWGLFGPENARFVSFVRGPRAVFDYMAGLIRFTSRRYVGHSPAGGAMVVALLAMIALTAGTGMATLATLEGQGPLSSVIAKVERPPVVPGQRRPPPPVIRQVHDICANITLILVGLHVAGVILASFAHRENLVMTMITGRKRPE